MLYVYYRMEGLHWMWQRQKISGSCYRIMVRFCCCIPIIPAAVLCTYCYYDVICYVFRFINQHSPGSSSRRQGDILSPSAWCHCSAPGLRSRGTAAQRRVYSAQLICLMCVLMLQVDGRTMPALLAAAYKGDLEIVQILLQSRKVSIVDQIDKKVCIAQ